MGGVCWGDVVGGDVAAGDDFDGDVSAGGGGDDVVISIVGSVCIVMISSCGVKGTDPPADRPPSILEGDDEPASLTWLGTGDKVEL